MPIWMILLGIAFWAGVFYLGLSGQGRPKEEKRGWTVALVVFVVMATILMVALGFA